MAAATRTRRTATTKPAKAEPVEEEPEELEAEDTEEEDMEELEEDEVSDEKPAPKKSSAAAEITFGIRDLVELIEKKTGQKTDPRGVRTLIRKMARDGSGRVNREITPGNRTRYDWSGPNDPEVVKIVKAFSDGELEAEKQAKLTALKENKAAKTAAKKAAAAEVEEADEDEAPAKPARRRTAAKKTTAPARRTRKQPEPELVEDDEELELDDEE
jgi:hypothetical protein